MRLIHELSVALCQRHIHIALLILEKKTKEARGEGGIVDDVIIVLFDVVVNMIIM